MAMLRQLGPWLRPKSRTTPTNASKKPSSSHCLSENFDASTEKERTMVLYDYTTIQRMTIPRLTKWRPDFDILMIQRLFFLKKKGQIFFPTPHGFHLKTFPTPHGCQKLLILPLTGFFYPWRELIFSLKKLFLTRNLLQIGKNGLNWPSFFYVT